MSASIGQPWRNAQLVKPYGQKIKFSVNADLAASAEIAAKELLALDYEDYAYVGFPLPLFWSKERENAFCAAMQQIPLPLQTSTTTVGSTFYLQDKEKPHPEKALLASVFMQTRKL